MVNDVKGSGSGSGAKMAPSKTPDTKPSTHALPKTDDKIAPKEILVADDKGEVPNGDVRTSANGAVVNALTSAGGNHSAKVILISTRSSCGRLVCLRCKFALRL